MQLTHRYWSLFIIFQFSGRFDIPICTFIRSSNSSYDYRWLGTGLNLDRRKEGFGVDAIDAGGENPGCWVLIVYRLLGSSQASRAGAEASRTSSELRI